MERWAGKGTEDPGPGAVGDLWEQPRLRIEAVTVGCMHDIVEFSVLGRVDSPQPAVGELAAARSLVRGLLDLAGVATGRTHTLLALTADGPVVLSCRSHDGAMVFTREENVRPGAD